MRLRRIVGKSMLPTLAPDQLVVAVRPRRIKVGDVVIIQHDNLEKVKRVVKQRQHKVYVLGDNLARSTDSRTFGWLSETAVTGKVIWPLMNKRGRIVVKTNKEDGNDRRNTSAA